MVVAELLSLVIGLLVTGAAIYVGASVMVDVQDFGLAIVTGFVGSLASTLAALFLGWIPIIGGVIGLVAGLFAYLTVVNVAYPGGYLKAAGISVVAWLVLIVLSFALAFLGLFVPFF